MNSSSAIVVGGGLAGLSCGIALAEAGWRVRLYEKRPHLGGRAASYTLPDGTEIDNCQHVTLGCCTNLDDFYGRVGAREKIRFFDQLNFADANGRISRMRAAALPAPLHLGPSFVWFGGLRAREKWAIGRALGEILRSGGQPADARGISMLEWLKKRRQPPAAIANFWRLVLVSALDEELDRAEAQYGINVFWKSFLANSKGFRLGVPAVPLGELYAGCRAALERRGGEIRTRARAARFRIEENRAAALVFEDGCEETADAYIAAVPHDALLDLLPPDVVEREPAFGNLRELRASPITGVHLWYDRTVTDEPFLALMGLESQWIFNKSALLNPPPAPPTEFARQYLQVVISASYGLVNQSRQEIIERVRKEIEMALPRAREAQLVKATVVKETAATFSPSPGVDKWRPESRSPIGQLFLAGDWTRTGWPATMEGAVRSGYLAAQAVSNLAGQHRTFLQPDLPAEGFVHLWI